MTTEPTTTLIEVQDLSGRHIGRNVSVTDKNGWVHTGRLAEVSHKEPWAISHGTQSAWIVVKSVDDSRWMGRVEAMVTLDAPPGATP